MNITIFSGGSGNTQILKALYQVNPYAKVNVIVNAYDDGKSTGICRLVTKTLGVSDIRKNQYKIRTLLRNGAERDGIDAFMEDRFDLADWPNTREDVLTRVSTLTNTHIFDKYVNEFFDLIDSHVDYKRIKFKSFNLSNIVYSAMFRSIGYRETIDFFNKFLEIDTSRFNVLVNSYDNMILKGKTDDGKLLEDEASIVDFANSSNKISSVMLDGEKHIDSNPECIKVIEDSDVLIISTGTFWSSLYPTFLYSPGITCAINRSNVRKFWFINTAEDKDAYNVSVSELVKHLEGTGLNVKDFTIVENESAVDILRQDLEGHSVERHDFGNNKGKHEVDALARYFTNKFNEFFHVENIYVDFDDTIWSRNKNEIDRLVSINNVKLLNEYAKNKKVTIISGNTENHVFSQLEEYDVNNLRFVVDSNSKYFGVCKNLLFTISEFNIDRPEFVKNLILENFEDLANKVSITDTCIKIKPVSDRDAVVAKLNEFLKGTNNRAFKRGRTTIDILNINNNKANALRLLYLPRENSLYIGDEICIDGNDNEIASVIPNHIHIDSVFELYTLLRNLNK